ncbi:flagellar export chaperone FliS [Aquabacterium sp. OR-4]|uniref:flagellar export chaperone FliS n=1 Tax=Aquabacterium sp. OR-4 TaxID=2978127 RepID=UPI0028C75864|nr:flagellar export chaperone FliS [Aquabacterium sp. OR-4]MDT7836571.1 flagellar export chaperone FliS [Aquabacterium sp. OR-4]
MYSVSSAASPRIRHLAGAYHHVGIQTMVATATPHQLVAMLFDGFVVAVNRARGAIRGGDVALKGESIGHALRIVDEGLKSALNLKEGGKLASDLSDLYAYICVRLAQANIGSDEAALEECLSLIQPLREAWTAIAGQVDAGARS